jgi:hypothetical protein
VSGEYAPFVRKGEKVEYVVKGLEGMNRWLALVLSTALGLVVSLLLASVLIGLVVLFLMFYGAYARRLILVTDRAVVLLACSRFRFTPLGEIERFPIAPLRPKGFWLQVRLGTHRIYVSVRSLRQIPSR